MEAIEPYLNWIYLAAIVLAVLVFGLILIRLFGGKVRARKGARLGISEYYEVDKSRFLVLVRRDDVEHLVLVGGTQDVVIERGIERDRRSRQRGQAPDPVRMEPLEQAPERREQTTPAGEPSLEGGNVRPISTRHAPRPPADGHPDHTPEEPAQLRAVEPDPDRPA